MKLIFIGLGIYFILWVVKRIYAENWSKGIDVELEFSATECYPGDNIEITETIANHSYLPLPMLNIKFAIDRKMVFEDGTENTNISDKSYKCDVFSLLFFQRIRRKLHCTCTGRGYFYMEELDMVSTDLFMKNVVSVTRPVQQSITVFPAPLSREQIAIPYNRIMGSILTREYTYEDPFEFRSIREYQTYDTMSSINWNASARTGELKVNVYENTSCQEICILLNLENEGIWEYEELKEKSISLACSLAFQLMENGVGVSMFSNGVDSITEEVLQIQSGSDENHRQTIVKGLSRIDLTKPMQEFEVLLEEKRNQVPKGAMPVLISLCKKEKLQRAYGRFAEECADFLWIVPLLPGMDCKLEFYDSEKLIRWEV